MIFIQLLKIISVLLAAILLGNLFLAEVKRAKNEHKPWYEPYLTVPGLLIIVAILLPLLIGLM